MQKTILIIESIDSDRQLLASMAEKLGFKCLLSAGGLNALAQLKTRRSSVDLILLNLALQDIDGISVLGHCKGHYPDLPVIIIADAEDADGMRQARHCGADDCIAKPFERAGLASSIRKSLPAAPQARAFKR